MELFRLPIFRHKFPQKRGMASSEAMPWVVRPAGRLGMRAYAVVETLLPELAVSVAAVSVVDEELVPYAEFRIELTASLEPDVLLLP